MEENVGRERQGRPSRAHSSARRDAEAIRARDANAAAPGKKRGRRTHGTPVQGTHDHEAGSSAPGGSQRRSGPHRVEEAIQEAIEEPIVEGGDMPSDGDDNVEAVQPQPQEAPEEGYGGGPTDMSVLHAYHKHRAIPIWNATKPEDKV